MKINHVFKLLIAIVVTELAGIIGSIFTIPSVAGWYQTLTKSALNPPAWIFGPVWTILFALMGIALFLVWKKGFFTKSAKIALGLFIGQLVLNMLWSIIFFGLHSPAGAFIEIIFLWLAILATIIAFARISRPAAWLLIPYILWVSFAGYLTYSVWQLNQPTTFEPTACTMEAKLCPDGSSVGRTGPECEFAACPEGNNDNPGWVTATSPVGFRFQYPEKLIAQYISTQEWPPIIIVKPGVYSCSETPLEKSSLSEIISQRLVDDRIYCVDVKHEGAAGSVYSSYAYTTLKDGQLVEVSFTLRYPNCSNYDPEPSQACTNEREAFDLDATVDRIVQTIDWNQPLITDYDSCVNAGFSIMKSNPPQCATPDGRTFIQETNSTWEQALLAVSNCEVEKVFQAHSRIVNLTLKNGNKLIAREPQIDDIFAAIKTSESKCGKIPMATE
jgi:tryptophan-rich sensory protein